MTQSRKAKTACRQGVPWLAKGLNANGYYFRLPHKDKLPIGEFTYVTEGIVDLGKITMVFTTFSKGKDLPAVADSLRVIESARFVQANP